jgi:hypothetical protein
MNHSFDISYAKKYGVDEAIMISNFQYWLKKNWANEKHKHDGRTWTYNSIVAFEKLFPYWTAKQIRRVLDSLVSQGVLMRGEYNKSIYDRTSWYAFVEESTFLFGNHDLPIWANQDDQKGEPIPNINTDINTNTIIPPLSPQGETEGVDFRGLKDAVQLWLKYKAEKKQKYKSNSSVQAMINKLYTLSNGSAELAIQIIEEAMSNNYQGFFALKNKNRDGHHNVPPAAPSRKIHESFNFNNTNNEI